MKGNAQMKAVLMLAAGHKASQDPYLSNLLFDIRKEQLNQFKERARIPVPNSRVLLGICDPFGVLEYGQCFVKISPSGMVLSRKVAVSKNPCLHPGGGKDQTILIKRLTLSSLFSFSL
jgi:hypothetical protein